jgi:hypothetical protein
MAPGIRTRLTSAEGRKFAFTVGTAFLVLAAIVWWRGRDLPATVLGVVGGVLLLAGLVLPGQLGPVYRGWMGFAHVLSRITTPVFLAVIYFVVIVPTALLMRLAGRNPLRQHKQTTTFWIARDSVPSPDRMERQF